MERGRMTADAAYDALRRASHLLTRRLRDIARMTWRPRANSPAASSSVLPRLGRTGTYTVRSLPMSKKTKKRKAKLRRSKANHGKKPHTGR